MKPNRQWIFSWLIPAVAAVAAAGALLAWQWPQVAAPPPDETSLARLGASRTADYASSAEYVRLAARQEGNTLVTTLYVSDHWHINANPATLDFLIPTTVTATADDAELPLTVQYPAGHTIDVGLEQPIAVYDGRIKIKARMPETNLDAPLEVTVRTQACNDSGRCLPPATLDALAVR